MRIMLASSSSGSRGGGELYLLYLGRALAQKGHEVALWASRHPRMDELAASFTSFGQVLRSSYRNTYDRWGRSLAGACDVRLSQRVCEEWRRTSPDFIHLNKQNLEDGLDLLRAATRSGIPNLCTVHLTQSARYLRARWAWIRDLVSKRALDQYPGMLVTVLGNRRKDLADFLTDSPRLKTIPNGVPILNLAGKTAARATTRLGLGLSEDDPLFIAVGRMVPQKRPLVFLETARRILRTLPAAKFLWVGDGALAGDWDGWVTAQGLGESIRRLPWHHEVPTLLLAADAFVHVAEFEGLPLAILEAMSAGLPCAITANLLAEMPFLNASNSIAIRDDHDGWLVSLRDSVRLRAIGEESHQLAEAEFSDRKMAESYEVLYRETINGWS